MIWLNCLWGMCISVIVPSLLYRFFGVDFRFLLTNNKDHFDLGPVLIIGAFAIQYFAGSVIFARAKKTNNDNNVGLSVGMALGMVLWFLVGLISHYSFPNAYPTTNIFIAAGSLGIVSFAIHKITSYFRDRSQKILLEKERAAEKKRLEVKEKIIKFLNDTTLVNSLFHSIDRLTKYVPEKADEFYRALENDVEQYVMLQSYVLTTDNDIGKAEAQAKITKLQLTARRSVSEILATTLRLLPELQAAEADILIGEVGMSQLEIASSNFREFADAQEKMTEDLNSASLANQINSLSPASQVIEIRTPIKRQRLIGGDSHKE